MDVFGLTCVIVSVFMCDQVGSVLSDRQVSDVVKVFVTEGDDVILPCAPNPKVNIEGTVFVWKKDDKEVFLFSNGRYYGNGLSGQAEDFKGRVSHFVEELKHGNASILIKNTKTTDSGSFICIFPRLKPRQKFRMELVVGAAPEPYVKTVGETKDGVQLQCAVRGASRKPVVQWQNRAGDIVPAEEPQVSERGGRYDIILQTTVTKTDHYRCVSTQEEIHHEIYTETYVIVPDARGTLPVAAGVPVWAVVGLVVGVAVLSLLVGVVVGVVVHKRKTALKSSSVLRDEATDATEAETSKLNGDEETGATKAEETIELNGTVEQV